MLHTTLSTADAKRLADAAVDGDLFGVLRVWASAAGSGARLAHQLHRSDLPTADVTALSTSLSAATAPAATDGTAIYAARAAGLVLAGARVLGQSVDTRLHRRAIVNVGRLLRDEAIPFAFRERVAKEIGATSGLLFDTPNTAKESWCRLLAHHRLGTLLSVFVEEMKWIAFVEHDRRRDVVTARQIHLRAVALADVLLRVWFDDALEDRAFAAASQLLASEKPWCHRRGDRSVTLRDRLVATVFGRAVNGGALKKDREAHADESGPIVDEYGARMMFRWWGHPAVLRAMKPPVTALFLWPLFRRGPASRTAPPATGTPSVAVADAARSSATQ